MGRMIEAKTVELIGLALNWAVDAAISGKSLDVRAHKDGNGEWMFFHEGVPYQQGPAPFSTDWSHGGKLRDRFRISVTEIDAGGCNADQRGAWCVYGETALIAISRCVVASVFGASIMVPAELLAGDAHRAQGESKWHTNR
ncbi:MAG TPA: phage protein NinX family protein [Pseudomonas sp.]